MLRPTSPRRTMASFHSIKGVIFDMDGTMTIPVLDFHEMRRRAGITEGQDILVALETMEPERRAEAVRVIEEMELDAGRRIALQPGLLELFDFLDLHAKLPRYAKPLDPCFNRG